MNIKLIKYYNINKINHLNKEINHLFNKNFKK